MLVVYKRISTVIVNRSRSIHSGVVKMAGTRLSTINYNRPVVGIVQMTSRSDVQENICVAHTLIERAKNRGAEMVFLPECFDHVCESRAETLEVSETIDGYIINSYKTLAKRLGLWLSLGGFHEKPQQNASNKLYNTHLIINNEGEIESKYCKAHLFDVDIAGKIRLMETDFTIPGKDIIPPVETPVGKVGLGICYDVRFPEMSIALTQQGAEILTYPSAFTVPTGMAHWESLLRSRAIENQCYVIAAAQVGKHNDKRSSYGHSMVVDPWGCVIAECPDREGVCIAEIDLKYLARKRREMPVWNHRRHDLYGTIQINREADPIDSQDTYLFGQHTVRSSSVFYKSALSIAFVNRKPILPGLTPIRLVERFCELTPMEVSDLFATVQKVSQAMENHHGATSGTVAIQDGPEAGQTVKHVHVHILPRKTGDFKKNDDIYDKLENHDKNVAENEWRTDEDMAKEAVVLRQLF